MKILMKICILLLLVSPRIVYADDYKEYAKQVREDVWKWDMPEFKNYTIPEDLKNESAVILAHHYDITATRKNKFRVGSIFTFQPSKETYYYNTERKMILINDKSALDSYSEIKYKEEETTTGLNVSNKFKTIIGVRIIKPNGEIKEVNIEESVAVTEGKRNKENYKKLAISNLEIGDILDYFIHNEARLETEGVPNLLFTFANIYPIMSYSVRCEVGNKLTTEYRSMNGAPDFEVTNGEDGNKILWAVQKNIPKLEDNIWVYPLRQYPYIRLFLLDNSFKMGMWSYGLAPTKGTRSPGLYKDIRYDTILNEAQNYKSRVVSLAVSAVPVKQVKKIVAGYKKNHPNLSQEELAEYIFRLLNFKWEGKAYDFPTALAYLLNEFNVENKLGFVTYRDGIRKENVANIFDFESIVTANNNTQLFYYPSLFYKQINWGIEGEEILANNVSVSLSKLKFLGEYETIKVPISKAEFNKTVIKLNAKLSETDPLDLDISEKTILSGYLREEARHLIRFDIWDSTMRAELAIPTTQEEDMLANRQDRKYIDNYRANIETQKEY